MVKPDTSMNFAQAWTDAAFGMLSAFTAANADAMSRSLSACSRSAESSRPTSPFAASAPARSTGTGRSWYRAPRANLFGYPMTGQFFPTQFFPTSMLNMFPAFPALGFMSPMLPSAFGGMTGGPFADAMQAIQFWNGAVAFSRLAMPMALAADPIDYLAAVRQIMRSPWAGASIPSPVPKTEPISMAPFSTYRSESGHAVTQIRFPNDVVATVAVPSSAAFSNLALWRAPWTA